MTTKTLIQVAVKAVLKAMQANAKRKATFAAFLANPCTPGLSAKETRNSNADDKARGAAIEAIFEALGTNHALALIESGHGCEWGFILTELYSIQAEMKLEEDSFKHLTPAASPQWSDLHLWDCAAQADFLAAMKEDGLTYDQAQARLNSDLDAMAREAHGQSMEIARGA